MKQGKWFLLGLGSLLLGSCGQLLSNAVSNPVTSAKTAEMLSVQGVGAQNRYIIVFKSEQLPADAASYNFV